MTSLLFPPMLNNPTPASNVTLISASSPSTSTAVPARPTTTTAATTPYDLEADGPTRHGPRKRRKVTRSKSGCLACRQRKKRCDKEHPVCGSCAKIGKECHWPSLSVSGSRSRSSHTPQDHAAHLQTSISPGVSVSGGIDQNTSPARATGTVGGTGISSREVDAQVDELFGNVDVNGHVNVGIMADSTTQRYDTSPGFADLLTGISAGPIDLSWGMASSSGQGERVVWGASEREPWDGSFNMDEFLSTDFESLPLGMTGTPSDFNRLLAHSTAHSPHSHSQSHNHTHTHTHTHSTNAPLPQLPHNPAHLHPHSHSQPSPTAQTARLPTDEALLRHYTSQSDTSQAIAAKAFPEPIISASLYDPPGTGTSFAATGARAAVCALAARHLANQGEMMYEVVSQDKEKEAESQILSEVRQWDQGLVVPWTEMERHTVLAGLLTLIRLKVCRGDIWGYQPLLNGLESLLRGCHASGESLASIPTTSTEFALVEQIVYLDLFSSYAIRRGPGFPQLSALNSNAYQENLTPLAGLSFPLLSCIRRLGELVKRRRDMVDQTWDDDQHIDIVQAVDDLQDQLKQEKERLNVLTKNKPEIAQHRFYHEALRTTCLLQLRGYVLTHSPSAIDIGLLVRQNLSLLETIYEQKLPGWNLVHWVLFVTALNCMPAKTGVDERVRITKLYDALSSELAFLQYNRSRRVVEEVWRKNDRGTLWVDWISIVDAWGWELFLV